jgi:hypothetical protein
LVSAVAVGAPIGWLSSSGKNSAWLPAGGGALDGCQRLTCTWVPRTRNGKVVAEAYGRW